MRSRQSSGPVWFETRDYIRWRPVAREGWLVFVLFAILFGWIVLSDITSFSFGSLIIAGLILVVLLFILCLLKGRKI